VMMKQLLKAKDDIRLDDFLKIKLSSLVRVPVIVIYKNQKDYPDKYVARLWDIKNKPTHYAVVKDTLEEVREAIPSGMCRMGPSSKDDPVIVETWA